MNKRAKEKRFAEHCKKNYSIWSNLISKEKLMVRIFRDMLKEADCDWVTSFIRENYRFWIDVKDKRIDQFLKQKVIEMSLEKRQIVGRKLSFQSEDSISSKSSNHSKDDKFIFIGKDNQFETKIKGFKPRMDLDVSFDTETLDLPVICN